MTPAELDAQSPIKVNRWVDVHSDECKIIDDGTHDFTLLCIKYGMEDGSMFTDSLVRLWGKWGNGPCHPFHAEYGSQIIDFPRKQQTKMLSPSELDRQLNTVRWTISNRTSVPLDYTITGVARSPAREHCIVLYAKLPEEVSHLHFARRDKILEGLGILEPEEGWEDTYPIILVNKLYGSRTMSDMNKYSFFRNFRKTAIQQGVDPMNIHSARHLIGRKLSTKFLQMRKLNTDVRFWTVDRVGIQLSR